MKNKLPFLLLCCLSGIDKKSYTMPDYQRKFLAIFCSCCLEKNSPSTTPRQNHLNENPLLSSSLIEMTNSNHLRVAPRSASMTSSATSPSPSLRNRNATPPLPSRPSTDSNDDDFVFI